MSLKYAGVLAAAFAAAALVGALPRDARAAQSIRIGFHAPLTGFAALDGQSALQGAQLAVAQVNAAGGVNGRPLELVVEDDQARADQAVPLANKYVGSGVKIVISGSYSAPTRAAAGVFQKAKIPYISAYALHPDITRAGDYVFRTSFVAEVQGKAAAKFIGEILKRRKVTFITLNNDFGQALSAGFREVAGRFGLQIASEYNYGMSERQFGSIVASVKHDDPAVLYVTGYYYNGGPLVAQLRASGVTAPIVGTEGFDTSEFIKIAKGAAEGVMITTSLDRDSTSTATRRFIDDYQSKFNAPANMVAACTHTAVTVAAEALRRAGSEEPAKVRNALAGIRDFDVATGRITFNNLGEVRKAAQIEIIKGGAFHHFATIDDPVLLTPPTR
jgi:branched-chain amino acid transport system substrate-binding protein